MDLAELIKGRRSIRRFSPREIPREHVQALMEAALWAPSAGNLESRHFHLIYNQKLKKSLVEVSYSQRFIAEAPLVICASADMRIGRHYRKRGMELYAPQDVAASIQNILLTAHGLGLGACWIGAFDEARVTEIIDPPPYLRPVALIPVGYPSETPAPPPRSSIEAMVTEVR